MCPPCILGMATALDTVLAVCYVANWPYSMLSHLWSEV